MSEDSSHSSSSSSGSSSSRSHRRKDGPKERRLIDYLLVVREHWIAAVLVAAVILGGFGIWTLRATPIYETKATIQLEENSPEQTVLAELSTLEKPSSVETEMEVMRSFSVALGATRDEEVQLTSVCWEKNAYRPLAAVERRLGWRRGSSRIFVRTAEVPTTSRQLELRFDDAGKSLVVADATHDAADVRVNPFEPGRPFTAFGLTFTVRIGSGGVDGRTFVLWLRPPEEAARWIQSITTIDTVGDRTGIVSVGVKSEAPEIVQDVANAVARSYLRLRREQRERDLDKTVRFLTKQIDAIQADVKTAEDARDRYMADKNAFRLRARVSSIARDQSETKLEQIELQRKREETVKEVERWQSAKSFEERLSLLVTGHSDSLTAGLAGEYTDQQRQIDILKSQFSDDHPQLKAAQVKLAAVRRQLEDRLGLISENSIEKLQSDVARLDAKLEETKKTLEGYEKDLAAYPEVERTLAEMDRAVETKRKSLERLVERSIEVEISKASDRIPAVLIDEAQPPRGRKAPNVGYMAVLGALFGLLGGIAAAFLRDAIDHKVRSPDELEEELGTTNYAAIPSFTSVRKKDRRAIKSALVTLDAPRSVISEAYRTLRANIRFARQDKEVKALAITSALASEGKTVTTLNLGVVLAEGGATVVVIDADMRRSMVHEYMGCERSPGLSEVLTGKSKAADAIRHSRVERLDLLPAGERHERPGTLLDSPAFQNLLVELRKSYDYVLVDMPPVLAVSDAAPFFARLDGVLLLCRAGRAPAGVYQGALEQVERLGGKVLGTIFNGFDARRGIRAYRYGYGGYYGYHAYYAYDESRRKTKSGDHEPESESKAEPAPARIETPRH